MKVHERIRYLRKEVLKLSQEEFAKKINVSRSNLGNLEINKINVTERVINDICREFRINEEWLLNGNGEIFKADSQNYIEELVKQYSLNNKDKEILEAYVNMNEENRNLFYNFINSFSK